MISTLNGMNIAMNLFDRQSFGCKSDDLITISSKLLTMDPSTSGHNPLVTSKAHSLLRKLYSSESSFLEKKVLLLIFNAAVFPVVPVLFTYYFVCNFFVVVLF